MSECHVRYFAGAEAATGVGAEVIVVDGTDLAALKRTLLERHSGLVSVLPVCSLLIDGVVGHDDEQVLESGVHVDVLPPFAGG